MLPVLPILLSLSFLTADGNTVTLAGSEPAVALRSGRELKSHVTVPSPCSPEAVWLKLHPRVIASLTLRTRDPSCVDVCLVPGDPALFKADLV